MLPGIVSIIFNRINNNGKIEERAYTCSSHLLDTSFDQNDSISFHFRQGILPLRTFFFSFLSLQNFKQQTLCNRVNGEIREPKSLVYLPYLVFIFFIFGWGPNAALHFTFCIPFRNRKIVDNKSPINVFCVLFISHFCIYYKILEFITDSLYETWFSPAKMILDFIFMIYVSIIIKYACLSLLLLSNPSHVACRMSHVARIKPKTIFAGANLFFYFIQLVKFFFCFVLFIVHYGRCTTIYFDFRSMFRESFDKPMTKSIRLVCFLSLVFICLFLCLFKNVWSCCFNSVVSFLFCLFSVCVCKYANRLFVFILFCSESLCRSFCDWVSWTFTWNVEVEAIIYW